jgi:hypothetical protein
MVNLRKPIFKGSKMFAQKADGPEAYKEGITVLLRRSLGSHSQRKLIRGIIVHCIVDSLHKQIYNKLLLSCIFCLRLVKA